MEDIKCIDFASLNEVRNNVNNDDVWSKIGSEVVSAFHDIGFFYIKNHGISKTLIKKIHDVGQEFFSLPEDLKKNYSKDLAEMQGYVEINREVFDKNENLQELRESFDVSKPNGKFPSEVADLRPTVCNIISEGTKTALKLLKCLEVGLGLPENTLIDKHKSPFTNLNGSLLRILHYPPIPEDITEGAVRCGVHTDYGTFTLLFQDEIGGLEVKRRDGQWVKADPIKDTVLVNAGDLLQMWTAGKLIATEHRVRVPKEEIMRRCARKSVVLFFHPENEVLVKPFDGSETYPPVLAGNHLKSRYDYTFTF